MSLPLAGWLGVGGKILSTGFAVVGMVWLAQNGPFPGAPRVEMPPLPPEARPPLDNPEPAAASPAHFVFDDLPLATESWSVRVCDPGGWDPFESIAASDQAFLLRLERSPEEALAVWIDGQVGGQVDGRPLSMGTAETGTEADGVGSYHTAQHRCLENGRAEEIHTWIDGLADPEALRRHWAEPVTERLGPVPLLADAVQLFRLQSRDWSIFLDQPDRAQTAPRRQRRAMELRGWTSHMPVPGSTSGPGRGHQDFEILMHGDELCLVHGLDADDTRDGRGLILTACRGLAPS